ncbi:hypothetical protein SAMN05192534_1237 [Alteribacillus persepolensis]|uniref:Uncharacterized protein n=1 Tax=Alteribacillus persepolensis TaxID=568899 RepID=A0A1G8I691_9BACI|nr:hypothetical protein [Alteribacillus persepolensis]SDI14354.1 hypothetical protein SAMN05192534_1237 [Alteribacillus persepolensis]
MRIDNGMLEPLPWEYEPRECLECGEMYEQELIDRDGVCVNCGDRGVDPILNFIWRDR